MANRWFFYYYISFSFYLTFFINSINCNSIENQEVYIVYLGSIPNHMYLPNSHHQSLLSQVLDNGSIGKSIIRSYQRSFNAFATKLTKLEAEKLSRHEEVLSVFPSKIFRLHTTRSWSFLNFDDHAHQNLSLGSDIIVGVIDTGIWPESKSFNDKGYPPPPKRWKGTCESTKDFKCNNKIIGARHYSSNSSRDYVGHGSHTASIIAGNKVDNVSFFGLANGTARGGLPNSRIATYKACGGSQCNATDILAAFDDAIADGVDIISISLGSLATTFFNDVIAIGSFHASERGILTVHAGGNEGPDNNTISSVAPWLLSVAASSTDRRIIDNLILKNGKTLVGSSINTFSLNNAMFPIIHLKSPTCTPDTNRNIVKGKILLCDSPLLGIKAALQLGAAGLIVHKTFNDVPDIAPLPAIALNDSDYAIVKSYLKLSKNPKGMILKSHAIKDLNAPIVASFSSRGPNPIVPEILKPDISAPGVAILAAYSPAAPVVPSFWGVPGDDRHVNYNILSGTSMACPHVAAVAAYIKSIHHDWSPSAVKSAIMTTASVMNSTQDTLHEFSYGSGHINPLKAIDPGLIYKNSKDDYLKFLCGIGYGDDELKLIYGNNVTCPKDSAKLSPIDLNYPSLTTNVTDNGPFHVEFHRTVTNVGLKDSTYKVKIFTKFKFNITVNPEVLSFTSLQEKKSFIVTVSGKMMPDIPIMSASLEWFDGTHNVRSPIVIYSLPSIEVDS